MRKLRKRLSPLCYLKNGDLLAYRYGVFCILHADTFVVKKKIKSFFGFSEKYLSRIGLLYRLLRLGVRNSIPLDNNLVLIFVQKKFYELNIETGSMKMVYEPEPGIRALNISHIQNVQGFDDRIVFGGYLSNSNKNPVSIYGYNNKSFEIIYTFPENTINHIHNIVADSFNKCVWIFTGDFGNASAIWKATENFTKIAKVFEDDQKYRACVAWPVDSGVIYATDAPFYDNSIRFLFNENGTWQTKKIMDVSGSCIYGCKIQDKFIFSTAVEPDGRNSSLKKLLLDTTRGIGIKDNCSHLYIGNLQAGFQDVYRAEKDRVPFLFQFGVLKFPGGENNSSKLLIEHIATRENDCSAIVMDV